MRTGLADFLASPATTSLVVVAKKRMVRKLQSSPTTITSVPERSVLIISPSLLGGNSRKLKGVLAEV